MAAASDPLASSDSAQSPNEALGDFSLAQCLIELEPIKAKEISLQVISLEMPVFRFAKDDPCISRARDSGVKLTKDYLFSETLKLGDMRRNELAVCVSRYLPPERNKALKHIWNNEKRSPSYDNAMSNEFSKIAGDVARICDPEISTFVLTNRFLSFMLLQHLVNN